MIEIKFPADRPDIAKALGAALIKISGLETHVATAALKTYTEEEEREMFAGNIELGDAEKTEQTGTDQPQPGVKSSGFDGIATGNEVAPVATPEQKDEDAPVVGDYAQVDTKGVPFNPEVCGKAKEPFYASGPRKGQWKKRKGVSDEDYDAWYASEIPAANAETQQEAPLDTADAFQQQTPPPSSRFPSEVPPIDCGTFMGWVSAQQAAGCLTQQQVTDAYTQLGIEVTSLFPPNDANTIAGYVGQLHSVLSQLAAQA